MIETRRVYEEKHHTGGYRILVDRVWPRGLKKEEVKPDLWLRDVAPSNELRKWYGHDPAKWPEFRKRYFKELKGHKDDIAFISDKERDGKVILLYGARETRYNNAVALKEFLESHKHHV
ncbi:MAG: DUF488 family protein [Actinobacteria bacterium]|nr:DUF488 family protein [Actinomycetota bacterium]MCL5882479.1 DUF488 family protein [Actinomycetota bacterium]